MNAVAYDAMSSPRYCSGELRNPPSLVCFVVTSISLLFSTLFSSSSPNNEPYLNTLKASILRDKSATTVSQPSTQNLTPLSSKPDLDTSRPPPTPNYQQRRQGSDAISAWCAWKIAEVDRWRRPRREEKSGEGEDDAILHVRRINPRTSGLGRYVAVGPRNPTAKKPPTYGRSRREASAAGALCPCMSKAATGGRGRATGGRRDGI